MYIISILVLRGHHHPMFAFCAASGAGHRIQRLRAPGAWEDTHREICGQGEWLLITGNLPSCCKTSSVSKKLAFMLKFCKMIV